MKKTAVVALGVCLIGAVPAAAEAQPSPATARNILLCHGDAPGAECDTGDHWRGAGAYHEVTALVTDAAGAPVPEVPVAFYEQGVGRFVEGGDSTVAATDTSGVATAVITGDEPGASDVFAEISPPGTPGGFRGTGAADDECEQPAGPDGTPRAGNCAAGPVTVMWEVPPPPACDDAIDNDHDGFVDYPDDPSCSDPDDVSEDPFDFDFEELRRHRRRISIRFRDRADHAEGGLVVFGRVRLEDEDDDFRACKEAQPVNIQRRVDDRWETQKSATTNRRGRYSEVVLDKPGPYRAVAARLTILVEATDERHVCLRAGKAKTHHHRR